MSPTEQLTLFNGDHPGVGAGRYPSLNGAAFDAATHHRLDDQSWITHLHGLVDGDHALMRQLGALHGWEQRSRWMYDRPVVEPRLTNEFRDLSGSPEFLVTLADALGLLRCALWLDLDELVTRPPRQYELACRPSG